jgi:hypothetical protein
MPTLFKIDDNVELPSVGRFGSIRSARTETILALKPGQSFFVAKDKACKASDVAKQLSSNYGSIRKNHPNRRFAVRSVTENGKEGARIWRLPDIRNR